MWGCRSCGGGQSPSPIIAGSGPSGSIGPNSSQPSWCCGGHFLEHDQKQSLLLKSMQYNWEQHSSPTLLTMTTRKKMAIVTGGGGGIGSAYATRLLERGYRVVLADLNKQLGAKVQAKLGADTLFVYCDVASWESQAEMFKEAYNWGGRIDLFIANAGIEEREHFYQLPDNIGEPVKPDTAVIDINLYSVLYGLRLFRHYNKKAKKDGEFAHMLITTSLAGFYPFPAAPVYATAKHGVRSRPP